QGRIKPAETPSRPFERGLRDVDRRINRKPRHPGDEDLGLAAGPGAEFDERAAFAEVLHDLLGMSFEQRDLHARRIIFGESRDFLEKLAAARIIEEPARKAPVRAR